jgi:hypothetical protein
MNHSVLILRIIPLVVLLLVSCSEDDSGGDLIALVESTPVSVPQGVLESCPFRDGLPPELLPVAAGGADLNRDSVVRLTTPCGLRTIWGHYDDAVLMIWKAPDRDDAESGVMGVVMQLQPDPERIGEMKAVLTMNELATGTIPMGSFYPVEQIVETGTDDDGIAWFTTSGENAKYWGTPMHPMEPRSSFWWRSGLWIVGVDVADRDRLRPMVLAMTDHLRDVAR